MDRHISSFFQSHGSKPIWEKLKRKEDTIIYKYSTEQLAEIFVSELNRRSLIGMEESLDDLSCLLQFNLSDLLFDKTEGSGFYESDRCKLFIFRFDTFVPNMERYLSELTNKDIKIRKANISSAKWYSQKYVEFKSSLSVPKNTIVDVYETRKGLINLMYFNGFDYMLEQAIVKYQ